MNINSTIFRAYDIRGIYPRELNEDSAYRIGRAFIRFLRRKGERCNRVVIGRDNRTSSFSLFNSLSRGVIDEGVEVIDIGLATTPMFYFSVANYNYDGGIQITASHNPASYNGMKLVRRGAFPIGNKTGLLEIKKIAGGKFTPAPKLKNKIKQKEVLKNYIDFNFQRFHYSNFKSFRIAIDSANAVPGILIPYFKKKIIGEIYPLFQKLDGTFPHHSPNPTIEDNVKALKKEVRKRKCDLGVAFDGDGDRIIFLDEKGNKVSSDIVLALLSSEILKDNPGAKILYDISSSKIVEETIIANGGIPILSRIGHSFIKTKMRREDVLFGGEYSGHFYYKEDFFSEAPIFVFLKLLEILSKNREKFSAAINPFQRYFHSKEINFVLKNIEEVLTKLESKYKNGVISHLDGLRIDFEDWWFLARPSQTEPKLRLVLEAKKRRLLSEREKELVDFIKKASR